MKKQLKYKKYMHVHVEIFIDPDIVNLAGGRSHKPQTFILTSACAWDAWKGPVKAVPPMQYMLKYIVIYDTQSRVNRQDKEYNYIYFMNINKKKAFSLVIFF